MFNNGRAKGEVDSHRAGGELLKVPALLLIDQVSSHPV